MIGLKKDQKAKVAEFRQVAGSRISNSTAVKQLKANGWNLEATLNQYFNDGAVVIDGDEGGDSADALFDRYKSEEDGDMMDVDGLIALTKDLGIDDTDPALLAFACQCRAENCGEFKRAEFVAGCEALDAASLAALKARWPQLRASYDDPRHFERIYNFTFPFMCEPGKKIMDLEQAVALWRQLFAGRNAWAHTDAWCEFLAAEHGRPIVADTWRLLLPFRRAHDKSFDNFKADEAWPVLIDEFVEWMQERQQ